MGATPYVGLAEARAELWSWRPHADSRWEFALLAGGAGPKPGRRRHELPCGRDVMLALPEETAEILVGSADGC